MFGFRAVPSLMRSAAQIRSNHLQKTLTTFIPKYHFSQVQMEVQAIINKSTITPSNLLIANLR